MLTVYLKFKTKLKFICISKTRQLTTHEIAHNIFQGFESKTYGLL